MKSIYTCTAIKDLIQEYTRLPDYEIVQMAEGGCGYGDLILAAPGYKYVIIHEVFLNERLLKAMPEYSFDIFDILHIDVLGNILEREDI